MLRQKLIILLLVGLVFLLFACREKTEEPVAYADYLDKNNPVVSIEVEGYGVMTLQLFYDLAPNTVRNFIHLVQENYYNNLEFHHVIEDLMIKGGWGSALQCNIVGEFSSNGFSNPLLHTRGVISMHRTNDSDSATSQFFIMQVGTPSYDGQYAAFGGLVSGFDVLDAIASVATDNQNEPLETVRIISITVDTKGQHYDPPSCAS